MATLSQKRTKIIPTKPGVFTLEEVSYHTDISSCWIVIKDKVYDLTNFVDEEWMPPPCFKISATRLKLRTFSQNITLASSERQKKSTTPSPDFEIKGRGYKMSNKLTTNHSRESNCSYSFGWMTIHQAFFD